MRVYAKPAKKKKEAPKGGKNPMPKEAPKVLTRPEPKPKTKSKPVPEGKKAPKAEKPKEEPKKPKAKAEPKEAPKPEPAKEEDDFLAKAKQALSNVTGIPVEEIPEPDDKGDHIGNADEVGAISWSDLSSDKSPATDFVVYPSIDAAERAAILTVTRDLEDDPGLFNEGFLSQHLYMSETDIRVMAGEEADAYVEGYDDEDLVKEANMEPEYDEASDEEKEVVVEKAKEQVRDERDEYVEAYLKRDPIGYLVDELGAYTREEAMKQPWIQVDVEEAAEEAVSVDGYGHFIDGYDNDPHEDVNGCVVAKW